MNKAITLLFNVENSSNALELHNLVTEEEDLTEYLRKLRWMRP